MMDRMRELEARQDEIEERLSTVPADMPDIHPKIADIYRRKVERLAEALADPRDRDEAAEAIRGLIERIVLTPGEKRGEMHAALHGDLGTILEWAGSGAGRKATDTPKTGMSVSVVAGARIHIHKMADKQPKQARVDEAEVARFSALADAWWDPEGEFRPLHKLNPVRMRYIRDALCAANGRAAGEPVPLSGMDIVDVGCGGGLLCEPLARPGCPGDRNRPERPKCRNRRQSRRPCRARNRLPGGHGRGPCCRGGGASTRCWRSKWSSTCPTSVDSSPPACPPPGRTPGCSSRP